MYNSPSYYPVPQNGMPRMQGMGNQFPQYPQMSYSPISTSGSGSVVKGRPVSNEEEANAAMIDYDGSLFVFPDNAHGRIYTKQLGMDGNIIFCRYVLDQGMTPGSPQKAEASSPYVTREEMENYLSQQLDKLTNPKGGSQE